MEIREEIEIDLTNESTISILKEEWNYCPNKVEFNFGSGELDCNGVWEDNIIFNLKPTYSGDCTTLKLETEDFVNMIKSIKNLPISWWIMKENPIIKELLKELNIRPQPKK